MKKKNIIINKPPNKISWSNSHLYLSYQFLFIHLFIHLFTGLFKFIY